MTVPIFAAVLAAVTPIAPTAPETDAVDPSESATAAQTAEAVDEQQSRFVYSLYGPGAGNVSLGMAGGLYVFAVGGDIGGDSQDETEDGASNTDDDLGPAAIGLPSYNLHVLAGITDNLDFEFRSSLGILILFYTLEVNLGLRWRIIGNENFSLGLRLDSQNYLFAAVLFGSAFGGWFGASPGIQMSAGNEAVQFSLGLSGHLMVAAGGLVRDANETFTASDSSFTPLAQPWMAIEFPVGEATNMFIAADLRIGGFEFERWLYVPSFQMGASW